MVQHRPPAQTISCTPALFAMVWKEPPLHRRYRASPFDCSDPTPLAQQTISRTPPLIVTVQHPPRANDIAQAPFDCSILQRSSTPPRRDDIVHAPLDRSGPAHPPADDIAHPPFDSSRPALPAQMISRTPFLIARVQQTPHRRCRAPSL